MITKYDNEIEGIAAAAPDSAGFSRKQVKRSQAAPTGAGTPKKRRQSARPTRAQTAALQQIDRARPERVGALLRGLNPSAGGSGRSLAPPNFARGPLTPPLEGDVIGPPRGGIPGLTGFTAGSPSSQRLAPPALPSGVATSTARAIPRFSLGGRSGPQSIADDFFGTQGSGGIPGLMPPAAAADRSISNPFGSIPPFAQGGTVVNTGRGPVTRADSPAAPPERPRPSRPDGGNRERRRRERDPQAGVPERRQPGDRRERRGFGSVSQGVGQHQAPGFGQQPPLSAFLRQPAQAPGFSPLPAPASFAPPRTDSFSSPGFDAFGGAPGQKPPSTMVSNYVPIPAAQQGQNPGVAPGTPTAASQAYERSLGLPATGTGRAKRLAREQAAAAAAQPGLAHGGEVTVSEPSTVVGDFTGTPYATVGEIDPFTGQAQPEQLSVQPLTPDPVSPDGVRLSDFGPGGQILTPSAFGALMAQMLGRRKPRRRSRSGSRA